MKPTPPARSMPARTRGKALRHSSKNVPRASARGRAFYPLPNLTAPECEINMASIHPLHRLFKPRHVALLGVSKDTGKAGYKFLRSLLEAGFEGRISLLGRQAGELGGIAIHTDMD